LADSASPKGLILSENRNLRLFSFFLLYFAQGVPYGLTVLAVPAWLAANNADDGDVAMIVAWAFFAWTWKFIVAAFMDRYTYLPMGRRRIWLIGSQVLISAALIGAAILSPGVEDIFLLVVVTIMVNTGAASQDVAVDGLAVDLLPEKEQGTASGFMFGGQAFGIATATAAGGYCLQNFDTSTTFLLFIPIMLIPTIYAIVIKERPGEKRLPWSEGKASPVAASVQTEAWIQVEKDGSPEFWRWKWDGLLPITLRSLFKGASLWFILCQSIGRTAGGIATPLIPILGTQYVLMDTSTYTSTLATIDLVMAFVGLVIGSWLTIKLGAKWATACVLAGLSLLFVYLLIGQATWTQYSFFLGVMVGWSLFNLLNSICSNPIRMQLSDKRVGATQFTIYNSLANLPVGLGATLLPILGGTDHLERVLMVIASMFALAGIGYALLRMPKPQPLDHEPEHFDEALGGEIPARVD